MPALIIRLHPVEPIEGPDFTAYLTDLTITAYDISFADMKGEKNEIGKARYLRSAPPNPANPENRIFQHYGGDPLTPSTKDLQAIATAVIELKVPADWSEYGTSDLRLKIERDNKKIVDRSINYNVFESSVSVPVPLAPPPFPPSVTEQYFNQEPVSVYLALPEPERGLDLNVAQVELPTDGTPPNFGELKDAVRKVLEKEPANIPNSDMDQRMAQLTPEQCRHIAYEIVWNRQMNPLPVPSRSLEEMYTKGMLNKPDPNSNDVKADRTRFEAELLGYYATQNAKAERLGRFIFALSAAIFCQQESEKATQVGFQVPIRLSATDSTTKIQSAEVILSNP
jgi:hypothetical protein